MPYAMRVLQVKWRILKQTSLPDLVQNHPLVLPRKHGKVLPFRKFRSNIKVESIVIVSATSRNRSVLNCSF